LHSPPTPRSSCANDTYHPPRYDRPHTLCAQCSACPSTTYLVPLRTIDTPTRVVGLHSWRPPTIHEYNHAGVRMCVCACVRVCECMCFYLCLGSRDTFSSRKIMWSLTLMEVSFYCSKFYLVSGCLWKVKIEFHFSQIFVKNKNTNIF